ncbi:MAG: proteasome assembly chaperone family protein [Thermoplasmata archaeon]
MAEDIEIFEMKRQDHTNAIIIDGFPTVGLVSSIVANYIINIIDMEQIGVMESDSFPPVSLVKEGEPLNPVRIYAGTRTAKNDHSVDKLVVFLSEFQPPQHMIRAIAHSMLDWAKEQKCSMIISPGGLVNENEENITPKVYGAASTKRARELYIEPNVTPLIEGVISGVSGVLLNEGKRIDYDVISFLAEAHKEYPDARAAAKVIDIINTVLLKTKVDPVPLIEEAEKIENQIKMIQKHATTQTNDSKAMYS